VCVHGDLPPASVAVADSTLAGVVDLGDLFVGDPAFGTGGRLGAAGGRAATRSSPRTRRLTRRRFGGPSGLAMLKCLFRMLMGQNGDRGLPGGTPACGVGHLGCRNPSRPFCG
jgi:hypothetical protein